jgi:hypothetical protein
MSLFEFIQLIEEKQDMQLPFYNEFQEFRMFL